MGPNAVSFFWVAAKTMLGAPAPSAAAAAAAPKNVRLFMKLSSPRLHRHHSCLVDQFSEWGGASATHQCRGGAQTFLGKYRANVLISLLRYVGLQPALGANFCEVS
jgi:hypothetical protein